jgi:hypothetical protein
MLSKEQLATTEKPKMPEIIKEISVKVPVKLNADYDNFAGGYILMSATDATFQYNGQTEHIRCSMGGESVEVSVGKRRWSIKLNSLVEAAVEADEAYQKEVR